MNRSRFPVFWWVLSLNLLFGSGSLPAQSEYIDYCRQRYDEAQPDSMSRLLAGMQLSDAFYHFDHQLQLEQIAQNRALARQLKSENAEAVCCLDMAMVSYWYLCDGEHFDWRTEALLKFDETTASPELQARFFSGKFLTELMLDNCDDIAASIQRAYDSALRLPDRDLLQASVFRKIAFVRLAHGSASPRDTDIKNMLQVLAGTGRSLGLKTLIGWERLLLGMDRRLSNPEREALLQEADQLFIAAGDRLGQTRTCGELAQLAIGAANFSSARNLLTRRLQVDEQQGLLTEVYSDYLLLAKCDLQLGVPQQALDWLAQADELPKYRPNAQERAIHYQLAFESYLAKNDQQAALEHAKLLIQQDDLAEAARAVENYERLKSRVAELKHENASAIHAMEYQFNSARQDARQTQNWLTFACMALTIVFLASLFQVYRLRLNSTREALLHETQLKQQQQHVLENQRMQSLGLMAGGVAHDFNNLLVGILCNAELLRMKNLPEEIDRDSILNNLLMSAHKAAELSQQMLTYAGRKPTEKLALDLNLIIQKNLLLFQSTVGKGCELVLRLDSQPALTIADVTQLEQILLNLLGNARKACAGNGKIVVHTGILDVSAAELTQPNWFSQRPRSGRFSYLEVEDFGTGMRPEQIKHIFEPFYSGSPGGRGLGLAVVYGIVVAHDGIIRVFSREGFGTSIRILFPHVSTASAATTPVVTQRPIPEAVSANGSQTDSPAPRALPPEFPSPQEFARREGFRPPQPGRVLIVEDDPHVLKTIVTMLSLETDLEFCTAENGQVALELLAREPEFDCILLDLVMPVLDGKHFLELMPAQTPVVLMSGYSESLEEISHDPRVRKLIGKPFCHVELLVAIRETLATSPVPPAVEPPASPEGSDRDRSETLGTRPKSEA